MAGYTDAELQEIARWLRDGLSASKIAAAFSALRGAPVSRNAIIGIVHRNAMLRAIGFANGRGVPTGARRAADKHAENKRGRGPLAKDKAKPTTTAGKVGDAQPAKGIAACKGAARLKREPPPARRPPRLFVREAGVLIADGEAYRFEAPVPPRTALGRQPHGVAMRFIDCLFGRCRAPLDLRLEENPDNSPAGEVDVPAGRPGADMLCCGMRTRALKSYCNYHQARFRRRIFVATTG